MTIVAAMRVKPKDPTKLGVIKVQLETTAQKVDILRAKKRCEEHEDAEDITIKSCESHDARVGCMNSKLLLCKLMDGENYYITGHGVICKKDSNAKDGGSREATGKEEAEEVEGDGVPVGLSNNTVPCEDLAVNKSDKTKRMAETTERKPMGHNQTRNRLPQQAEDSQKVMIIQTITKKHVLE